jgi:hypothetical protein
MRPRPGHGTEPGGALSEVTPSHRQAYLQHAHKELSCCALHHSELAGLQGDDLREKQARLQELLDAADLQHQAMEPDKEASGTRRNNCIIVAGRDKSQAQQASSPNQGQAEHSQSNRAPDKSSANHHTQHSDHHSRQPRDLATVTSKLCNPP